MARPASEQSSFGCVPTLDEIARDPSQAARVTPEDARALLASCVVAQAALLVPALTPIQSTLPVGAAAPDCGDRYLKMPEVAKRTGLSLSYLYELARAGRLPVKRMGLRVNGHRPRGFRVLESDLLAWEASLGEHTELNGRLTTQRDGRRVPAAQSAARHDPGAARRQARLASARPQRMGASPGEARSEARRQTRQTPEEEPKS